MTEPITEQMKRKRAVSNYELIAPSDYASLDRVARKWFALADAGVVKLVLACLVANKLPTDPVWMFLVAESGGGKTELLQSLESIPETWHLSSLTENTFISGYGAGKQQPSLLLDIGSEPATIVFKDFTTILEMDFRQQAEIFSQFREIYDGRYAKRFGTGQNVVWEGKLGILSGSTPVLEQRLRTKGAMGERFLNYRIAQPSRSDVKRRIAANIGREAEMRDEMRTAFAACLRGVKVPDQLPRLPEPLVARIEAQADFVAFMRTVIFRDSSMQRLIEYIAPPEQSSRIFKQLYALACALEIIEPDEAGTGTIVGKVAESSVHSVSLGIVKLVARYATAVKTSTIAVAMGYPTGSIRRYLEDLAAAKVLTRIHQGEGKPDLWELETAFRTIHDTAFGATARDLRDEKFEEEVDIPVSIYTEDLEKDDDPTRFL